jgi:hypothetical protein
VSTFLHEDFVGALGSKPFDLLGWCQELDAAMAASGQPIPNEHKWLREMFYQAAELRRHE